MKKTVAYTLLLALILSTAACGSETGDQVTLPNETSSMTETESKYIDDLPADLRFNGDTVTFLYREEVASEFTVDEATGDVVDDAIFDSFRSVEERLNVNIANVKRLGHTQDHRSDYMNHITSTILAGDDEYDWVDLMIGNSPTLMNQGIFIDLVQNEYIDLDKPYYLGGLIDQCAVDGRLYFVSGDASLGYMKCAFCMYFNQRLMDEYKIENPYDLVDSGKWTLDKLGEIATKAAQDINGDGKYDLEDKLGFVVHENNHPKGFRISTDSVMYKKDSSGEWKFTYGSERDEAIVNKLYELFFVDEGACFSGVTNSIPDQLETYNKFSDKFRSGDIFIMTAEMDDSVAQLRNMKDDYGILPYPKYDESDEYRSSARNTHNAFSMPVTTSHEDIAGAVLEALSSEKYETVLPAYFETALKKKYARDDDSSRMYDLIRETMTLDFGYIYSNAIGWADSLFNDSYMKENSFASNLASRKSALETNLETYMSNHREMINS